MNEPRVRLSATVLDAADPPALASFYAQLLGWPITSQDPDWVMIRAPEGAGLSFQREPLHVPPVWPAEPGAEQMQLHLDIAVDDLAAAVSRALQLGARVAPYQPQQHVRVLVDPEGHPFCLFAASS